MLFVYVCSGCQDGIQQDRIAAALDDKAVCAGGPGQVLLFLTVMDAQDDDPRSRLVRLDPAGGSVAVEDRHFQVHQDYIREQSRRFLDRFAPVLGFCDHRDLAPGLSCG